MGATELATIQQKTTNPKPLAETQINVRCFVRDAEERDLESLTWFGTLNEFRNSIQANYEASQEGRRRYLVADLQGFPVGQTVVSFEQPSDMPPEDDATAYLYAMRVLAPLRGMGIGNLLMQAADEAARQRGCRRIRLTVQTANARAQEMYSKLGYQIVGTTTTGASFTDGDGHARKSNEKAFVMERAVEGQPDGPGPSQRARPTPWASLGGQAKSTRLSANVTDLPIYNRGATEKGNSISLSRKKTAILMPGLEFFRIAAQLKNVRRRGWVDRGVTDAESVADHSYLVAMMAATLAEAAGLDSCRAVKLALVHDLPETLTGDIPPYDSLVASGMRPEEAVKRWRELSSERKAELTQNQRQREREALTEIIRTLPDNLRRELYELWTEYETGASPEAKFVQQVDKLEALMQAVAYQRAGQPADAESFLETARTVVTHPALAPILRELEAELSAFPADHLQRSAETLSHAAQPVRPLPPTQKSL